MGRTRRKPQVSADRIGTNPFTIGFTVPVNKTLRKVVNKFSLPDLEERFFESAPFCKVFEVKGYKKKMMALSVRGKELLLYLIHSIEPASDYLWIDRVEYMKQNKIKSINTFRLALNELSEALYIYPMVGKNMTDMYWINPHFFFKGSRILKYPNNVHIVNQKPKD